MISKQQNEKKDWLTKSNNSSNKYAKCHLCIAVVKKKKIKKKIQWKVERRNFSHHGRRQTVPASSCAYVRSIVLILFFFKKKKFVYDTTYVHSEKFNKLNSKKI